MIRVTDAIAIAESELEYRFITSPGPGGQNVNRVATAVQLRFDSARSPSLPDDVRARLGRLAGKRMSAAGVLQIQARRYRSQERNRADALERFVALVRRAASPPTRRTKTGPTRASIERRLEAKRQRAHAKRSRRVRADED